MIEIIPSGMNKLHFLTAVIQKLIIKKNEFDCSPRVTLTLAGKKKKR